MRKVKKMFYKSYKQKRKPAFQFPLFLKSYKSRFYFLSVVAAALFIAAVISMLIDAFSIFI
jgi:hypothetical protein